MRSRVPRPSNRGKPWFLFALTHTGGDGDNVDEWKRADRPITCELCQFARGRCSAPLGTVLRCEDTPLLAFEPDWKAPLH